MIIGFAGRMRSGKTELAKICEARGYKKLYFALPLKQLCADILDISVDGLNQAKNDGTDLGLYIGDDICEILADETEIPLENVREVCFGKTLSNVREMLQFIGTDLIRKYNRDWHVNRVRAMIDGEMDYVIDDVRFPNEKKMIEDLGGDCWFVTRYTIDNVSNHESETSITWHDCWNKIIINDSTLHYLLFKWEVFMDSYEQSKAIRDKEFDRILENGFKDDIKMFSGLDMLMLSDDMFTYAPKEFDKNNIREAKMVFDGRRLKALVEHTDGTQEFVENSLNVEELKMAL